MGFAVQRDLSDNIQSIDRHSTELVYLIDRVLTTSSLWGDLRVVLARAGRFYVVFGSDMGSREIMEAARDGAHDSRRHVDTSNQRHGREKQISTRVEGNG